MWPFDSTYKTQVGTVVSRAIPDNALPNAIRSGGMYALVHNSDSVDATLDALTTSIAVKAERMLKYGKEHYVHGLPSGQFYSAMDAREEVTAVLEGIYGAFNVSLIYCHYRPPNMQHIGWMRLVSDHGYDPVTNRLGNLSTSLGQDVYLDNLTVIIPSTTYDSYSLSALEQWGVSATAGYAPSRKTFTAYNAFRPPTPITKDYAATTAHIQIDYSWEAVPPITPYDTTPSVIQTGSFDISLAGFDPLANYFQVSYVVDGVTQYWMYQADTGTYPTLDNYFNKPPDVHGTFFPFVYFRYNKVPDTADKSSAAYLTGKKLLNYLGMNYDTMSDSISHNPSIGDVQQAMLIMAVPANSTNPLELRYLYSFFDELYASNLYQYSSPSQLQAAQYFSQDSHLDLTKTSIVIQDARFKMALGNSGITKRTRGGSIGAIGDHTFTLSSLAVDRSVFVSDGESSGIIVEHDVFPIHIYRRQVTSALYEEIQVIDLKMVYNVYGTYTTVGSGNSSILLIPVDDSITKHYSMADREALYSRSLHYVFNSLVETEIAWYQSEFFQFVVIVVALVATAYGFEGASEFALSITAGNVAMALAVDFAIGVGISYGLKAVVKAVGLEKSLLIAVVAMVVSISQGDTEGCLRNTPWTETLLKASVGLAKAVSQETQELIQDLSAEFDTLKTLEDASSKELTAANKLLENKSWLSPIEVMGETPEDFYNRTTHSGNVGILSIGAISSYTEIALRLPKLNDTLGDSYAT
jgi:hypothetical protein